MAAFTARLHRRPGILVPAPGDDDDLVLAVAPDIKEGALQILVRALAPPQRAAVGMECHFEDAVLASHPHAFVALRILVERGHGMILPGRRRPSACAQQKAET